MRAHPWVLSTDIRIRPGQAELTTVAWDEATRSLRLRPTRDGKVFLRAPKEFRVTEPADLWIAKDGNDASLSVRVPLGPEERVVRFVPLEAAGRNSRDDLATKKNEFAGLAYLVICIVTWIVLAIRRAPPRLSDLSVRERFWLPFLSVFAMPLWLAVTVPVYVWRIDQPVVR